jgi:hypothetical protein
MMGKYVTVEDGKVIFTKADNAAAEQKRRAEMYDDLLAACKRALKLLENIGSGNYAKTPAGDDLRAVIARAEGGE